VNSYQDTSLKTSANKNSNSNV